MQTVVETDGVLGSVPSNKRAKKAKPSNLKLQEHNPIYEGAATYDSPLGDVNKHLLSPNSNSVPCTPLAESASRYVFDFPPKLPPPRKGSVSIPPKLETHEEIDTGKEMKKYGKDALPSQHPGDEYMVMSPGIPETKKVSSRQVPEDRLYSAIIGNYGPDDEYVSVK